MKVFQFKINHRIEKNLYQFNQDTIRGKSLSFDEEFFMADLLQL